MPYEYASLTGVWGERTTICERYVEPHRSEYLLTNSPTEPPLIPTSLDFPFPPSDPVEVPEIRERSWDGS